MKSAATIVSGIALLASIIPSVLLLSGHLSHEAVKAVALVSTIIWFIATPLWMGRELPIDSSEVEI